VQLSNNKTIFAVAHAHKVSYTHYLGHTVQQSDSGVGGKVHLETAANEVHQYHGEDSKAKICL